jgi:hypothetical protein
MNLHPYDGQERRFRDADGDPAALVIVAQLLGAPAAPEGGRLRYDLSFYSGGTGVLDVLGLSFDTSPSDFERIARSLRAKSVGEAAAEPTWAEDFLWLIGAEERDPALAAVEFVNDHTLSVLEPCVDAASLFFVEHSDVNDWTALWYGSARLNYRGFSQG